MAGSFGEIGLLLSFSAMGLLGGFTYVMFAAEKRQDLYAFDACRRYILGTIMGAVYHFMHSDWNYPNAVSSFVYGLAATFIIENILIKVRGKEISLPIR